MWDKTGDEEQSMGRHEPSHLGRGAVREDGREPVPGEENEGGDSACWAHLICTACGSVLAEGHRPGCPAGISK